MLMSELDYHLPPESIATRPAEPRDQSRLMVIHRASRTIEHRRFSQIGQFLKTGTTLVINETRVIPAKLLLARKTGAAIDGLFLEELGRGLWKVMLRTRGKARERETLIAGPYQVLLETRLGEGLWEVRLTPADDAATALHAIGQVPLPPYIEKQRKKSGDPAQTTQDLLWYQTVFARTAHARSIAAPTAGLHFTPALLQQLESTGIRRAPIQLDVGLGTFLPVETDTLEAHRMHIEQYHISVQTVELLRAARANKTPIVAVGTTSVRTLESAAPQILSQSLPQEISATTDLKIAPGHTFHLTDALITNFHLPRSTLMALVAAFLGDKGVPWLKDLYTTAIAQNYRFYSYGDAMLIL